MELNDLSYSIIGSAMRVHSKLGPGLIESVYEEVMTDDLTREGFFVEGQKDVPIVFDDRHFKKGFRADLIVDRTVVVEIKSIERLAPVHLQQLLTYIRLARYPLGLLLNFGAGTLREGIRRVINSGRRPLRPCG